jgi:hypothetical protein
VKGAERSEGRGGCVRGKHENAVRGPQYLAEDGVQRRAVVNTVRRNLMLL